MPLVRAVVGGRTLLAIALLSMLLGAAAWRSLQVGHGSMPRAMHSAGSAQTGLSGLPAAARAPVSAALGADAPAYAASAWGEGYRTVSHPQHLRAHFDRAGASLSSGSIHVGLRLRAAGYGNSLDRVDAVMPRAEGNRVTYAHEGLSEWYVNGPLGLEQGFTVRRPPDALGSGPLSLSLAVTGARQLSMAHDGRAVVLSSPGSPALRYDGLTATDASGRQLPSRLVLDGHTVLLRVATSGARFPLTVDPLIQQAERPLASGEQGEGRFGLSVALSADGANALIGAPGDNQFAGAAWVFTRAGGSWTQQGPKLTVDEQEGGAAGECAAESSECGFGRSVALSADGSTALIGAPRENEYRGAAWVFTRSGSSWSGGEKLIAGAEEQGKGRFGRTVALSGDGNTALIGAPRDKANHGSAWVFTRSGSSFGAQGLELTGVEELGEAYFGRSLALSADSSTALIGGPGDDHSAGAAWVFTRSGAAWSAQRPKLTGGEETSEGRFGFSVASSADGDTALIGGREDGEGLGAAWVFARSGSAWAQQGPKLTGTGEQGEGELGYSTAVSADGGTALVGAPRDGGYLGAAWEFTRAGTTWTQQQRFVGDPAEGLSAFGTSLALAGDGGTALIGGPRAAGKLGGVLAFLGTPTPPTPGPNVTSIEPSSGPSDGGAPVTIRGSGFLAGATVAIGSAATSVTVSSETEITAVTAPTPAGSAEVVVTDRNGSSTGGPSYTYLTPPGTGGATTAASNTAGAGPTPAAGSGVLASVTVALAPPKIGLTGNLTPLSGVVRVKLPGSSTFILLTVGRQIPFGSIVDATNGKVAVTTAGPGGAIQTMTFYEGEFKLTQRHNGLVVSILVGGDYSACPTARQRRHLARASSKRGKHAVRKLWAEGHGSYSTKGNYATGAVLGTRWLTEDLCEGTLIRVLTDRVAVTNLITHRHVTVKAGSTYVARP